MLKPDHLRYFISKRVVSCLTMLFLLSLNICHAQIDISSDEMSSNIKACTEALNSWTNALNNRNTNKLNSLYSDIVLYYQSHYTKEQVSKSHNSFFKKNTYFQQRCENITVAFVNGCQAQLTFDKYVQTKKGGPEKKYKAYLHFIINDGKAYIIGESDATTDDNIAKKRKTVANVDNETPLDAIFCNANVGKVLEASYWDLVELGEKEDGPLAKMILTCGFPRGGINGVIHKDYNGTKGTFYCGGYAAGGECYWPVIFVYTPATKEITCIGGENRP